MMLFGGLESGANTNVRAQNKAGRPGPLGRNISRAVTDLYPSRGYTHPVTRAIDLSHAACKTEF